MSGAFRSFDGTRISYTSTPGLGIGPPVLLAHGTGFNSGAFAPIAEGLREHSRMVVGLDHRNHGGSQGGSVPSSWWDSARDCLEAAQRLGDGVVGIGHSMGGATLLLASVMAPDRFGGLIVIEPIVSPPPFRRDIPHRLVEGAESRRAAFESRAEAQASLSRPFGRWVPQALDGYVIRGVDDDGSLRCAPHWEAETFRAGFCSGSLGHLERVSVPVLLLLGSAQDTYPKAWADEIASRCRSALVEVVEGTDHFMPMTHPQVVVDAYASFTSR